MTTVYVKNELNTEVIICEITRRLESAHLCKLGWRDQLKVNGELTFRRKLTYVSVHENVRTSRIKLLRECPEEDTAETHGSFENYRLHVFTLSSKQPPLFTESRLSDLRHR